MVRLIIKQGSQCYLIPGGHVLFIPRDLQARPTNTHTVPGHRNPKKQPFLWLVCAETVITGPGWICSHLLWLYDLYFTTCNSLT